MQQRNKVILLLVILLVVCPCKNGYGPIEGWLDTRLSKWQMVASSPPLEVLFIQSILICFYLSFIFQPFCSFDYIRAIFVSHITRDPSFFFSNAFLFWL